MFVAGLWAGRYIRQDLRPVDDEQLSLFVFCLARSDPPRPFQLDRVYQFIIVAEEIPGGVIDVSPAPLNLCACVNTFEITRTICQKFMVINECAVVRCWLLAPWGWIIDEKAGGAWGGGHGAL